MTTRQLLCAVIAIVCFGALVVEAALGGSAETLRISLRQSAWAGVLRRVAHSEHEPLDALVRSLARRFRHDNAFTWRGTRGLATSARASSSRSSCRCFGRARAAPSKNSSSATSTRAMLNCIATRPIIEHHPTYRRYLLRHQFTNNSTPMEVS